MVFPLHLIDLAAQYLRILCHWGASCVRVLLILNQEWTRTLLNRIYLHQHMLVWRAHPRTIVVWSYRITTHSINLIDIVIAGSLLVRRTGIWNIEAVSNGWDMFAGDREIPLFTAKDALFARNASIRRQKFRNAPDFFLNSQILVNIRILIVPGLSQTHLFRLLPESRIQFGSRIWHSNKLIESLLSLRCSIVYQLVSGVVRGENSSDWFWGGRSS